MKEKMKHKKWGRPRIEISRNDPELAKKVWELRSRGLSWKKIAIALRIAITTARGLYKRAKNELEGER